MRARLGGAVALPARHALAFFSFAFFCSSGLARKTAPRFAALFCGSSSDFSFSAAGLPRPVLAPASVGAPRPRALAHRDDLDRHISLFDNGKNEGETAAPLRLAPPKAAWDCWYNAAQRDRPRGCLGARESRINARRRKNSKNSIPFLPQKGPSGETGAGRERIFPLAAAKAGAPAGKNRFGPFFALFSAAHSPADFPSRPLFLLIRLF